jgi:hypothetical protein
MLGRAAMAQMRCDACGEEILKGKERVVPPEMPGLSHIAFLVHANSKDCKRETMLRTNKQQCPRQGCASKRVHFVAPGGDAGHGNYAATNPPADIWECEECRRPFLLSKG